MNFAGMTFFFQEMYGFYEGGTRCQHRVRNDNHPVFQFGAGYIVETYLETSVFIMFSVSGNKSIVGFIKIIQQSLVQGQTGAKDRRQYGLFT